MLLQHKHTKRGPMLELKFNAPELRDYVKSIPKIKDQFFDLLRMDVKEVATDFINGVMSAEFELFIGRASEFSLRHREELSKRPLPENLHGQRPWKVISKGS